MVVVGVVGESLPVELDCAGDDGDVDGSPLAGAGVGVPETEELPVEGFDIELSVFGVSGLLQAPSAATAVRVAAMAI